MRERLKLFFRTIISVNQLSINGAVSDLCEEYKACHVRTGRLVLAGQSDPLFVPTSSLMKTPTIRPMILRKKIYCKSTKNDWKGSHNKIVWLKFVLMQDSWQRLTSDSTSWQKTLKNSHNLQNQWHVVSTLCQEMKNYLTRKVGFEGTPSLDPCWEVTTSYLQGKYWVEIRIQSVNKDNSHSWVRISDGLNKLVCEMIHTIFLLSLTQSSFLQLSHSVLHLHRPMILILGSRCHVKWHTHRTVAKQVSFTIPLTW